MWKVNRKVFGSIASWGKSPWSIGARALRRMYTRNYVNNPVLSQMSGFGDKVAIIDRNGSYSYKEILQMSAFLGENIKQILLEARNLSKPVVNNGIVCGPRVAFLCANDVSFAVFVCAVWQVGGIAVPLCKTHPIRELEYVGSDSQVSVVLSTQEFSSTAQALAQSLNVTHVEAPSYAKINVSGGISSDVIMDHNNNASSSENLGAMILYTSGTTGRPKGVLLTHGAIRAQILALVEAWEWSSNDCILHVLPLHHLHGIVNLSFCSLWSGATCYMLPKFDAQEVWKCLLSSYPKLNLFMAVPTIYSKLLQSYKEQNYTAQEKFKVKEKCKKFRLMVSGSAALPESVLSEWETITGMRLLERYGMTEIGMALSNPVHGKRLPGHVGSPLPNVKVKIVARTTEGLELVVAEGNQHKTFILDGAKECNGELYVKGPSLFKMYWNRPEATKEAFTHDGWFKTGDTVAYQNCSFKVLGRTSADIIKSGGYKISALDVEDQLLTHPDVVECAVVGVTDLEWGQRVGAVIACAKEKELSLPELKSWAQSRMISYHIPSVLKCVESIPRNVMGKVNKKELVKKYFEVNEH